MTRGFTLLAVSLAVTGCAASADHQQRPTVEVKAPLVAKATRTIWYRNVERASGAHAPVTLSEADLETALDQGAAEAGVSLLRQHYLPLLGGTAEMVVQPEEPVKFAEGAGTRLTTLLGPLGRDNRPYLVTVVDEKQAALLVLGWTPGVGGAIGEGVAWQAPGIQPGAIVGQPATLESTARREAPGGGDRRDSQVTDCYKDVRPGGRASEA